MAIKPRLTVTQILRWADAYHARTGKWPNPKSGPVKECFDGTTWCGVGIALHHGSRGLPGGSSLARLLEERRGVRNIRHLPPLSIERILEWADAHRKRTGQWPKTDSGRITEASEETWSTIDQSLKAGRRGLPAGLTLAKLLARHRGKRNRAELPRLTVTQILQWADAHLLRAGQWPKVKSGPIEESPGDTWQTIQRALDAGVRGLPGGSSLARILEEHRGAGNRAHRSPLSISQILGWADAHYRKTGRWPVETTGQVSEAPDETWNAISQSLRFGRRGLPGGSSLAQVLSRYRGKPNTRDLPRLTYKQILAWADEHHKRTGQWPRKSSGPVRQQRGTTWSAINGALWDGARGLPGRKTLAGLLEQYRGVRVRWWPRRTQVLRRMVKKRPGPRRLTIREILTWADKHHERTGSWPNRGSGIVLDAPQERWDHIAKNVWRGGRGLPKGRSLAQLLTDHRGIRNRRNMPRLTIRRILAWADDHHRLHGEWPRSNSGPVRGAPGETWAGIASALSTGSRGLSRKSTLARLLSEHRGRRHCRTPGRLTIEQILNWADEHKKRTGSWPKSKGGAVAGAPGESWNAINIALQQGCRGLPRGTTLPQLLAERRQMRNIGCLPRLTIRQILAWADEHRRLNTEWPRRDSGPVKGVDGETWAKIDSALKDGLRGLPRGCTLARLLAEHRNVRAGWSLGWRKKQQLSPGAG